MEVEEKEDSIFDISLNEVDDGSDFAEEDDAAHRLDSYLTIAELREAFSLEELMRMTKDGVLQSWLWERLLDAEAQELSQEKTAEMNDDEIRVLLCRLFDVDVMCLSRHEAARLEQSLEDCRIGGAARLVRRRWRHRRESARTRGGDAESAGAQVLPFRWRIHDSFAARADDI